LLDGYVKYFLGEMSEAHLLREVKAQQSIGILIGTSFSGMVGMSKVDIELVGPFHLLVVDHLHTIVESARLAVPGRNSSKALLCC
jgi:hypothetical protein